MVTATMSDAVLSMAPTLGSHPGTFPYTLLHMKMKAAKIAVVIYRVVVLEHFNLPCLRLGKAGMMPMKAKTWNYRAKCSGSGYAGSDFDTVS